MAKRRKKEVGTKKLAVETEDDAEREKRMFMRVAVGCIMAVMVLFWLFNLKYQFKINQDKNSSNGFDWSQAKTELDRAMAQVKSGLAEIKKLQQAAAQPQLTDEQINSLKGKLINEVASSTATSTIK